jgi:prepilin signal peptidase PulO-like enzyme (type II secretory pathway)
MMVVIVIVIMAVAVAVATNLICWNATHGELLSCLSHSHFVGESNDLYELIRLTEQIPLKHTN